MAAAQPAETAFRLSAPPCASLNEEGLQQAPVPEEAMAGAAGSVIEAPP